MTDDLERRLRESVTYAYIPTAVRGRLAEAADEIARLRAENETLREALEPFAKAADIRLCGDWRDDQHFGQTDVQFYLTFGDLRRARQALQEGSRHE